METEVDRGRVYTPCGDVVAREIEGELIIVPVAAGIGDAEDDLYTLNETGKAVWNKLDGQRSLNEVIEELSAEFEAAEGEIAGDVVGLIAELVQRKILVSASPT
jgi:hypothetical protein